MTDDQTSDSTYTSGSPRSDRWDGHDCPSTKLAHHSLQRPPTHRLMGNERGMTLFEVLIALAIAAALLMLVTRMVAGMSGAGEKSEVMKLAGAMRYAYGRAAINGWRYDVVFNLDQESYQIVCSKEHTTVDRDSYKEKAGAERAFDDEKSDPFADSTSKSPEKTLETCSDAIVSGRTLEHGVTLQRVQTSRMEEPIDIGKVRTAIFPNGIMERTVIWLKAGENQYYTLFTDEMTGRIRVLTGEHEAPDRFFEVEED